MAFLASSALVLATLVFLGFLAARLGPLSARQRARRHNGCQDPPSYPHKDPLGKDLSELSLEAYKQQRFLDLNEELFEKYGATFKTLTNGKVWIKTKDPKVSKAIYSTFFGKFGLEPIRYERDGFFGDGILVTDGARWKHSRALIRPAFEIAHITNFDRLHRHVGRFMGIIPQDGSTVDLLPLFKRLTLDLSTEFIFGKPMNALSTPDAPVEFLRAFTVAQKGVVTRPSARDAEWQFSCEIVHKYIDQRIEEAVARVSTTGDDSDEGSRYMRLVDELAKVLSVFSPAHDTVAVTLGNLFFHLARNESAWNMLRKEILPTIKQPLTHKLLNSYKYLNWALHETHCITLIAQASQRECLETCILPVGGGIDGKHPLFVEKGTVVETNFRCMHRDKQFWGNDAEDFRPERWELVRPTWEFTPFSGGPRICPALKLVYLECEYIAATLVRNFSTLEIRDPEPRWVEERRLIYQSRNGTLVGLIQ
ncbi:cytochrome P450 [Clohesyomyces aquaticus]|uniref:Cytochrome P450 n=1 Tax=Clohesyomyces aquaticus TaxID=1231657 RepID=A0A1Y2A284_9PLEO|nr:cytochrome P450 [Clohesyomyces aquaticus]